MPQVIFSLAQAAGDRAPTPRFALVPIPDSRFTTSESSDSRLFRILMYSFRVLRHLSGGYELVLRRQP